VLDDRIDPKLQAQRLRRGVEVIGHRL